MYKVTVTFKESDSISNTTVHSYPTRRQAIEHINFVHEFVFDDSVESVTMVKTAE